LSIILVTGTGTGVGKTTVAAAVAALAHDSGLRVAYVKLAQTGTDTGDSDVAEIARLTPLSASAVAQLASYPEPLAPATAARRSGLPPLQLDDALRALRAFDHDRDFVIVEGAGGLLVQFDDLYGWTLADVAEELDAPVLVVAAAGLGTLNHTALTAEALRRRDLDSIGVVIGAWPDTPGLADRCNLEDIASTNIGDLVGALPAGLGVSDRGTFLEQAAAGLAPLLGGTFDAADFIRRNAPEPKAAE
jgi:dethiobiotin synthetase